MPLSSPESNQEAGLIVHFGYHKAMTMFFKQVLTSMADRLKWYYKHHNSNRAEFYKDAIELRHQNRVISVNNASIEFEKIPTYVGSHLIRDPRDLLVSGYRYHLWCHEDWVTRPINSSLLKRLDHQELGLADFPQETSYQQLLNSVDKTSGLMMELNWRGAHFRQMEQWDFENPRVLELRYEEVFGNETHHFSKLFSHYGLEQSDAKPLLKHVDRLSFSRLSKNMKTGAQQHASVGEIGQWKTFLPDKIKNAFKQRHGELLVQLGYESDLG